MKIQNAVIVSLLMLWFSPVFGQSESGPGPRGSAPQRAGGGFGGFGGGRNPQPAVDTSALTKFSLDFPGGKPKELVAAIQQTLGKPLNAIVPDEFADMKLPPLRMANVNAADLFRALMQASFRQVAVVTGRNFFGDGGRSNFNYTFQSIGYGFRTEGTPTDDSIWYFFVEKPAVTPNAEERPERISRFYLLTPYLQRGLTVDDITTAIQTGWKMLGDKETPVISFHKETKLLIAVGDPSKLDTIDAVLKALQPPAPREGGRRLGGFGGFGGGIGSGAPATNSPPAEEPKINQ